MVTLWLWLGYTNSDELCRTWTNWKETDIVTIIEGSHLARTDFEVWKTKHLKHSFFFFYILSFQRKFTNWTTMLLEQPKDEVALLSVFLLLRIPLFEPVSFEIVPGEYANRLASTYRSNSTCRSSHGNRQGRAFLCFALRRATCPPRSLSSMRRTRFPAIKMHVRSSIHDHNYARREHRAERGLYLHTCDTVRAR